jgi:hypothetical protein
MRVASGPWLAQPRTPIRQAVRGEPTEQTPETSMDELGRMFVDGSTTVFDARP